MEKNSWDRGHRKGSHPALASLSDVQEGAKIPLSILLSAPGDKPLSPGVLHLEAWPTFTIRGFITVSVPPCKGVTAILLPHRLCDSSATLLTVTFTVPAGKTGTLLSTCCRQLYVRGPDMQTQANSTPPPTSCLTSLCPASPSLVAVTFHTKVFASLAQRQLVNWQLGQASTFSSGVSVRVVCTWAWLDEQAHVGLVLVEGLCFYGPDDSI